LLNWICFYKKLEESCRAYETIIEYKKGRYSVSVTVPAQGKQKILERFPMAWHSQWGVHFFVCYLNVRLLDKKRKVLVMKRLLIFIIIFLCFFKQIARAHGFGLHLKLYDKIIEKNLPQSYIPLISDPRYRPYFLYGCMFPDIQYANKFKPVLQNIYSKIRSIKLLQISELNININAFDGLTYEIGLSDIPDYQYVFGFDTHHEKYGIQFAEYMLTTCGFSDIPGPDPGGDEAKCRKLAFALGYYAHLAADIVAHNFVVPKLTAQLNLGDIEIIKNPQTFASDPNSQMEGIIETINDYYYGLNEAVVNTVYWDVWVALDQFEPTIAQMDFTTGYAHLLWGTTWLDYSNIGNSGLNPVLQFFFENVQNWYYQNPYNLPTTGEESYRTTNPPLNITGFRQLATIFRFVNRFYPATVGKPFAGKQRLDQVLADWISNHLDLSAAAEAAGLTLSAASAGFLGLIAAQTVSVDYLAGIAYPYVLGKTTQSFKDDIRSLVALMLSDMNEADKLVQSYPDYINQTEYNKLKSSILFTNPTSLLDSIISESIDLAAVIYDQIGPGGRWYTDWSPWHNQSMRWGALSSLNNLMPSIYKSQPNVAIYDAYFTINGQRVTGLVPLTSFDGNPIAKVIVELYNTTNIAPIDLTLRVKKDNKANNYSLDQIVASKTFSIDQNPYEYNRIDRLKVELSFQTNFHDFNDNRGYYFELIDNSDGKIIFTSAFKEYKNNLTLTENYNTIYGMYSQWPVSLGNADYFIEVIVDQKLINGSSVDSIKRWENTSFVNYAVPRRFQFKTNSNEVLCGSQKVLAGEKYQRWLKGKTDETDIKNHHVFNIDPKLEGATLISQSRNERTV